MEASRLISQLRHRRVIRALVGYGVAAFAVLQIVEPVMHGLHWPEQTLSYVVVALAAGFPIVVALAWIFDVNEGRIERTASTPGLRRTTIAAVLCAVGIVAAAPGLLWYFVFKSRTAVPAAQPSIAVLPFADMSAAKDQEYFSDGIAEQILDQLAQVPGLKVIGRTSSFSFKGKGEDLRTIGEKLGVGTLLEGSVRKAGDRIRITAQLIKAADGSHIWSDTYDRELTDVFAVQDGIARAVVEALRVRLLSGAGPITPHPPRDPEAYRLYLLGRSLNLLDSDEAAQRAIEVVRKGIGIDPSYAPLWDRLATLLGNAALLAGPDRIDALQREALEAAERAIALEPQYYGGYCVRGWLRSNAWDWRGAQADTERTQALGPNTVFTLHYSAAVLHRVGRIKEAIALQRKATELEPLGAYIWKNLGWYLIEDGQYDAARAVYLKTLELSPQSEDAAEEVSQLDLLDGHPERTLAANDKLRRPAERLLAVALAEHDLGHLEQSRRALSALTELKDAGDYDFRLAQAYAWMGDRDRAFVFLDRAYERRNPGMRLVKVAPLLRPLRSDERYQALLRRMQFPTDP